MGTKSTRRGFLSGLASLVAAGVVAKQIPAAEPVEITAEVSTYELTEKGKYVGKALQQGKFAEEAIREYEVMTCGDISADVAKTSNVAQGRKIPDLKGARWPNEKLEFHYYHSGAYHSLPGKVISTRIRIERPDVAVYHANSDVVKCIPLAEKVIISGTSHFSSVAPNISVAPVFQDIPGCVSLQNIQDITGDLNEWQWEIHPQQNENSEWGYYNEFSKV